MASSDESWRDVLQSAMYRLILHHSFHPHHTTILLFFPSAIMPVTQSLILHHLQQDPLSTNPATNQPSAARHVSTNISAIIPGPQNLNITARIVNMCDISSANKIPQGATAGLKLVLKDHSAALTVKRAILDSFP